MAVAGEIPKCLLSWVALLALAAAVERPYVNEKKAPDSRKDLETIHSMLTKALPTARAATVCIDLGEGSGSGVIVSADGLVLTAAHVSGGVGKKVTVILEDGTRLAAETLGLVADTDAAMIRITDPGTRPFVELDRDASSRLGDWVFSLGHSGGFDKARGSVVRLGRIVRIGSTLYQSDCNLIGGDSGGPLFDLNGRLIGIHSRVGAALQENVHVPIDQFIRNWDGMLKSEFIGEGPFAKKPVKGNGYMGFASEPRDGGGLRVTRVGEDSPAKAAGLRVGDAILTFNGEHMSRRERMQELLAEMSAGDQVALGIERGGKPQTLTFELGER